MIIAWRAVVSAFLAAVLAGGVAFGVAKADLFGLKSSADRGADAIQQRLSGRTYGVDKAQPTRTRLGQNSIAVLTVSDNGLNNLAGSGWLNFPPTYLMQSVLIEDLMNPGGVPPTAIFLDIAYRGHGGDTSNPDFTAFDEALQKATRYKTWAEVCGARDELMRMACIMISGGVPVVLGSQPPRPGEQGLSEVQAALSRTATLVSIEVDAVAYPLVRDLHAQPAPAMTPAMALYAAYCFKSLANGPNDCRNPDLARIFHEAETLIKGGAPGKQPLPAHPLAAYAKPIDIQWGSAPPDGQNQLIKAVSGTDQPCAENHRMSGALALFWNQIVRLRGPGEGERAECLYHLNLPYDRLVDSRGMTEGDLNLLLGGRIVMFGGQLKASNDWSPSPVHGQVPGVHLHAMALDNLIQARGDYRLSPEDQGLWDGNVVEALLLGLLVFIDALALMLRHSLLARQPLRGKVRRLPARLYVPVYGGLVAVSGLIIVLTWKVDEIVSRHALVNVFGLAAVVLAVMAVSVREVLPQDVAASLNASPHGASILSALHQITGWFEIKGKGLFETPPKTTRKPPPAKGAR